MKNLVFLIVGIVFILLQSEDEFRNSFGVIDTSLDPTFEEYFENSLEFFTFDYHKSIIVNDVIIAESLGKAFIAEGKIITAKHLTTNSYVITDDLLIIGDSVIYGLEVCKEEHVKDDKFYYRTRHDGVKNFIVYTVFEFGYEAHIDRSMRPGESGSPIICNAHSKVVALATGYATTPLGQYYAFLTKVVL